MADRHRRDPEPGGRRAVRSLGELARRAEDDPRYRRLALAAAENLGGRPATLAAALAWLRLNAQETVDEAGVVDEVNALVEEVGDGDDE